MPFYRSLLTLSIGLYSIFSFGQTPALDSLKEKIEQTEQENRLLELHQQIADEYLRTQPSLAFLHIKEGGYIAEKINDKKAVAKGCGQLGKYYQEMSNYRKALEEFQKAYDFFDVLNMNRERTEALNNIAVCHRNIGNYQEALRIGIRLVKTAKNEKDEIMLASAYNNVGVTYAQLNEMEAAKENLEKAIQIFEKNNMTYQAMKLKNNIAIIYKNLGKQEEALQLYDEVARYWQETGAMAEAAKTFINMGKLYSSMLNYQEAMHKLKWALELSEEHGNAKTLAEAKTAMADLYVILGKYTEAEKEYREAINIAKTSGLLSIAVDGLQRLSEIHRKTGNDDDALSTYQEYEHLRDSLQERNNATTISAIRMEYENEKQLQEIESLRQQNKIQDLEVKQQRNLNFVFLLSGAFLLLLTAFFFSMYRLKNRLAGKLKKQYHKIDKQKNIIENKNKQITDSINYAKRIQSSILQTDQQIEELFPQHFIFHQPRDIVSGDFYWFAKANGVKVAVAADCTGHGVPGAFMSMIGHMLLNEIVNEHKTNNPAEILKSLDTNIQKALRQQEGESQAQDGMDVAICCLKGNQLFYAGAVNPAYIIQGKDMQVIKGQPFSIGGTSVYRKRKIKKEYKTTEMTLKKGDSIYLFSDGYMDQFGGKSGNKFGSIQFKELLLNLSDRTMSEQKKALKEKFDQWKGDRRQLDDVLVIGLEV